MYAVKPLKVLRPGSVARLCDPIRDGGKFYVSVLLVRIRPTEGWAKSTTKLSVADGKHIRYRYLFVK